MAGNRWLLNRMRRSPAGWGERDFRRVYKSFGFSVEDRRKHIWIQHPEHRDLFTVVPRHNRLAPAYARIAVELVDELLRREKKEP